MHPPDPRADLAAERKWGRWARAVFLVNAVVAVGLLLIATPLFGHHVRHVIDRCNETLYTTGQTCTNKGFNSSSNLFVDAIEIPLLALQVVTMIWLRQAAIVGRRLGLPARRDPGWAFGFFVPVVNLWFPYQVARDTLPPFDTRRATVGWWWACSLTQALGFLTVFVIAIFTETAAFVVAAFLCALPVLAAAFGRRMVGQVLAAHEEILAGRRS
jgi:hypothetical protein